MDHRSVCEECFAQNKGAAEYRAACREKAEFHQRAIAAFAVALAPEWIAQMPRFNAVIVGEA
jgi:hypothetical protein